MSRWAPALRVARREALRARGRSALVVAMIALPVLGVTAADVVIQTADISGTEAIERRLGTADARITVEPHIARVAQTADPDVDGSNAHGSPRTDPRTLDDVETALGRDVEATEIAPRFVRVATDAGVADLEVTEADLTSALTDGLYRIDEGRVPATTREVAINHALADRGFDLGDDFAVEGGPTLTVVGIGDNTSYRGSPLAVVPPGALGLPAHEGRHTWLVDAGGAVTWDDVRALNDIGATVLSRAVLLDPPPESELDPELAGWATGSGDEMVAVIALVVAMALLEVVLLAGPAFAVIARRLQHSLALMAATGATPPQARRVVLASGLVLGAAGAGLGVGLGLGVAWLSLPLVQRFSSAWLGPYDVPWLHLLGIAGFGLVSALLAAVVPAWLASRQDVVAVLAGRRGDRRPSLRSPLLGLVLLGAGIAIAAYGARQGSGGEYAIAFSAIVAVLGMILLVPVVVVGLARLAGRLPLPMRYAVRDAARHRTRTVPAVAAVAATVAGVVALGIANASDAAESEATYTPVLGMGQGSVTGAADVDWPAFRAVLGRYLPQAAVTEIEGVDSGGLRRWTDVRFRVGETGDGLLSMYGSAIGTSVPVSRSIPAVVTGLSEAERAAAQQALDDDGAIVFTDQSVTGDETTVVAREHGNRGPGRLLGRATVPAAVIRISGSQGLFQGVLSPEAAAAVGVEPRTLGLLVDGVEITEEQERDATEALGAIEPDVSLYVERGFQNDDETVILLLVLGTLGGALVLGGTLTATFLSLSDARPDLATLSAVGASPRTRRGVAASYAVVIGVVGAVLGAAVGFVPGIAVTYPLTSQLAGTCTVEGAGACTGLGETVGPFLDVPWLLIGSLVVVLPLLTAAVVGLATRSRLPMVARVD
jgi:putative ABC transport system permease protein